MVPRITLTQLGKLKTGVRNCHINNLGIKNSQIQQNNEIVRFHNVQYSVQCDSVYSNTSTM